MSIADALSQAGAKPAGKRPYFLDPEVERILAITMAVVQELAVARQRVDTLERLFLAKGMLIEGEIDAFVPTPEVAAERALWTQEYLARILRIVQQENEAAAAQGDIASEAVGTNLAVADFEVRVPVLIVGGGACGCVAALAAHDAGVAPLLVEQDATPLGSTGMSQGLMCAAGTRSQADNGVVDDGALFYADIIAKTRGLTDPVIARAIAEGSGPALDWLVTAHGLPWTLDTGFRAAYGNSVMRVHGWHGRGGIDMIQLLHQKLADAGIDVLLDAKLVEIVADADGRVLGVMLERPDGAREGIGCDALVLASGGFAANHAMVAEHMPEAVAAKHNGHEGNRGDGIVLGARLGAATADMGSYQGYAMLTDPQGISVPPGVVVEGGILINGDGHRFVDETADIAGMVHPVMAQPGGMAWVVFDAEIEERCSYIPETIALKELNAAKIAESVAGLAQAIGVDAAALEATLAEAMAAQATGHRDAVGRSWGKDRPPVPPFRALKVCGALYHTQGGLQIDGAARVLRPDGTPLPNLFAGGGAARGVSGPSSWGYLPAMGLCAAITTGRIAGLAAADLAG